MAVTSIVFARQSFLVALSLVPNQLDRRSSPKYNRSRVTRINKRQGAITGSTLVREGWYTHKVTASGEKSNFLENFAADEKNLESVVRVCVKFAVHISAHCTSFNH